MRIGTINFPPDLLKSRKAGKLVVFAGAGVSIPSPSNYPNFRDLANKVADGVLVLEKDEPQDHFLGRLSDRGIRVHRLVKEMLTNPDSKPNSLHFDLLRLFSSPKDLRLVTTNFDPHFTTAARQVFDHQQEFEIYYAPALPLGHSFSGIVYIHGGVDVHDERLVLTDSDFGRAYLTEGWARFFLQRVFETYSVLFVGYSHNDPVMNYIARGFTPEMGRSRGFAIVEAGTEDQWNHRRIQQITYDPAPAPFRHAALPESLSGWAKQARLSSLEKEERIKAVVSVPPRADPESEDFIEDALSEVETAHFFTRHANSLAWVIWTENRKFLARLFDPSASLTGVDRELVSWIAETLLFQYPGPMLDLLRRQGQRLGPELWTKIGFTLSRGWQTNSDRTDLHRWVAILIDYRPPHTDSSALEYLAVCFIYPEDTAVALLALEYLARPRLRLEREIWNVDEDTSRQNTTSDVRTNGSGHWLNFLWMRFFRPNLSSIADQVEPMLLSHLQLAYLLFQAGSEIEEGWDSLSLSRADIEARDGGRQKNGLGVLIDAAFDVIEWNAQNRPERLDALVAQWFSHSCLMLKRLAIVGVALSGHWGGDRQLDWLLERKILYQWALHGEVFMALRTAYPRSSEHSRRCIVEGVIRGKSSTQGNAEDADNYKYALISLLHESDPKCPIARDAREKLQEAHPNSDAATPGPPSGAGFFQLGLQSPRSADELLSKPVCDQIDFLLTYELQGPFGPSRPGLMEEVTATAMRKHEWGWSLANELQKRKNAKTDLWSALLRAWAASELQDPEWTAVLGLLNQNGQLCLPLAHEIANLLADGIKKDSQPIPPESFALAESLANNLWAAVRSRIDVPGSDFRSTDWVSRAINDPAGKLVIFWLDWIERRYKEESGEWKGIPTNLKQSLGIVLTDDSYSAGLGRVLLASKLNFLLPVDAAWTRENVLPLFDWSVRSRTIQALHGFLRHGRQTEALLPYLIPIYDKAFPHISELGPAREQLSDFVAGLAVASSMNPLENRWLDRFILATEEQDRRTWTGSVWRHLRAVDNSTRSTVWERWIKQYWDRRLTGLPISLGPGELGTMVEWSLFLGSGFPVAAEMIEQGPPFELQNSFILRELADSGLPEEFPAAVGKLMFKALQNMEGPQYDLGVAEDVIRRIAPLAPLRILLKNVCNELSRLGYWSAATLEAWTQAQSPEK